MILIHEAHQFKFRYVNAWLSLRSPAYSKWNDGTNLGMPATRISRHCEPHGINWIALCAVAAVRSDYWRKEPSDWFALGLGGTFQDQLVNAVAMVQPLQHVEDLNLSELEIQQIRVVYEQLLQHCQRLADSEDGDPLPQPPPPAPPKPPKPEPIPPTPPKPEEPAPKPPKPPRKWSIPLWLRPLLLFASGALAGAADKLLDKLVGPGSWDQIIKTVIAWILGN